MVVFFYDANLVNCLPVTGNATNISGFFFIIFRKLRYIILLLR